MRWGTVGARSGAAARRGGGVKCKIATIVGLRSDVSYSWIARLHRNNDCIGYVSLNKPNFYAPIIYALLKAKDIHF